MSWHNVWPGVGEHLHFWVCDVSFGRHCYTQHASASYWSACICSTAGKQAYIGMACNRHEIECFLLQESSDQKCLWVCLLHSIIISLVSEQHHHPSMMHLSTHQGVSLGQKISHVHHLEKHLMGHAVYTFLGKKNIVLLQFKSNFVFSSIVTTNIQKTLQPANTGAELASIVSK